MFVLNLLMTFDRHLDIFWIMSKTVTITISSLRKILPHCTQKYFLIGCTKKLLKWSEIKRLVRSGMQTSRFSEFSDRVQN